MKTMKHTGKKVLSVFLAVLMIMTAWVFVAPEKATAAADVAPATTYATYHVKLTAKFTNIGNSGHIIIYYYPVNADGSLNTSVKGEYILVNSAAKYSSTTWTFDTADDSTRRLSTDTGAETGPVQGWPCGVKLKSESSATLSLTGLIIGNKSVVINGGSWGAGSGNTKEVLYNNTGSGWDGYLDWPVPAPASLTTPAAMSFDVPKIGTTTKVTKTTTSTAYDQYGVKWLGNSGFDYGYEIVDATDYQGIEAFNTTTSSGVATLSMTINADAQKNLTTTATDGKVVYNIWARYGDLTSSKTTVTLQCPKYDANLYNYKGELVKTYTGVGYYNQNATISGFPANSATTQIAGDDNYHQPYQWPTGIGNAFVVQGDTTFNEVKSNVETHDYGDWTQNENDHTKTCSVCGYVQTQEHIKGTGYVTKEETCTEDGVMTYDCAVCGKEAIETSVIDYITGHDFSGTPIENVTGENGNHWKKCSRCDAYGWAGILDACENHNWDKNADGQVNANDATSSKASTCKEAGFETYTCEVCSATWTKTLDLAAHTITATAAKDVTNVCGGDGNAAFWSCSVCNRVWKDAALTDELADTTDADGDGIPDALETKGPAHDFTGVCVNASNGADGTHYRQCSRFTQCGKYGLMVGDVAVEDATEAHKFTSTETASSCTVQGTKTYICSDCNYSYTEKLPLVAHTMETIAAVAPECGKAGNNEYYSCSTCGKYYKDAAGTTETTVSAEKLSALVHTWTAHHDYDTLKTAATCQNAAVYNNHCDYCKVQLTGASHPYGDPIAHVYNGTKKSNGDGTHSYACTNDCNCGTYGVGSTKDATENCVYVIYSKIDTTEHKVSCACGDYRAESHSYGSWIADKTGLGTEKGTMTRTCPLCSQTETTECSYEVLGRTEATCDSNGLITYICTDANCGHKYIEEIPATGHNWVEDNETFLKSAATCEANAVYYKYCTKCQKSSQAYTGDTWTKKGSKLTHDWNEWVQSVDENGVATHTRTCKHASSASCTETGTCSGGTANCVDKAVCTVCIGEYGEVDENNHKTVVTKAKVDSTCQKTGTEAYRYCEACETEVETPVTIEKKAHSYSAWTKVEGKDEHTRYCTTCDSDVAAVATQTENCTGGTAYCNRLAKCKDCKAEYGELDLANHSTESNTLKNAVAATCQAPGYTGDFYYDCCDALKQSGTATPKLDHSFTIEVEGSRVDATCIETGTVTYKCSTCDENVDVAATEERVLPIDANNHADTETTTVGYKAATCKDSGYTGDIYYTCCYSEEEGADNSKALKEKGRVIPVDGTNHTSLKAFAAVASTCQKTGNYAYSYCSTCGIYMMNGENVTATQIIEPKKAHSYSTWTKVEGKDEHTRSCTTCDSDVAAVATQTENCTGGTANCTDLAKCTTCNGTYGKLEPTIHKTAKTIAKLDPTCQKEGHEEYQHCDACGKDITTKKVINKLAHYFTEWTKVEDKDEHTRSCTTCDPTVGTVATETEACKDGTATCKNKAECSVCGQEYGALNPNNHISDKVVTEERVEATCQKDGWTGREYYECCYVAGADNSAALKNPGTTLPKVAHKYVEVEGTRVPATCLAEGTVTYKCSTCVDTEELDIATKTEKLSIDKNNHASDAVKVVNKKDATCATEGYTGDQYHECCYDETKTEAENKNALIRKGYKTPATGEHNLINAVPEYLVEYTENEDGVITGYTAKEDTLTYEQKITYRHADNNWYHVQICADCGEIVEDACFTYAHTSTCTSTDICEICKGLCSLVNLQKHPEGKLIRIPEVPSTCDNQGTIEYYKCEACGKLFFDAAGQKLVEDMDDLLSEETVEHSINTDVPAAPNTDPEKPGTHVFECNDCGDSIVVDCSGGEATCKAKAKCSVCGQEYGEIDEENHESDEVVIVGKKDATCSDSGYTGDAYYKCCYVEGAEDNSKALKAMGSATPSEPSLHVKKLRNDGDKHTVYCEGCGEEFETVDHNWVAGEVPDTASCTEGYDLIYTCECTATKTESVPAKGHDYTETVTEKAATCTEAGSKTTVKTCKVCGNTETVSETIKALGHDERTIKGVAPTCSTDGTTDYIYCNRCDIVIQNSTKLPATGCEDENHDGFCDDCGTYLRTNEDGTNCNCICHKKNIFMRILYKILNFFWKLFKIEKTCACGTVQHW